MPEITKRIKTSEVIASINDVMAQGGILGTIVLPKNLKVLASRLPKPNYQPNKQLKKYNYNNRFIK
jgi:hypothetical protein